MREWLRFGCDDVGFRDRSLCIYLRDQEVVFNANARYEGQWESGRMGWAEAGIILEAFITRGYT